MKEWAGKWIAHPLSHIPVESKPQVEEGERNAHYLFRHEFELGKVPEKAEMSLTGATWYRIWINGTFVEHGPIQSQVYYKFYNVRDVKQFLRPGRNAVAVEIYSTGKMFQAALLLEIRDETGRVLERSSGDWRSIPGEAWKKDVYFFGPSLYNPWQEIFDARRMPKGWKECGFDDSCWQKAKVYVDWRGSDIPPAVSPWLRLVERNIPFLREEVVYPKSVLELTECIHIRSLHRNPEDMSISLSAQGRKSQVCRFENAESLCTAEGTCSVSGWGSVPGGEVYDPAILLDFGIIIRGFAELELEGPSGTRIEIGYAEDLVDGCFNNAIGSVYADSIFLDGSPVTFRPFCWKSFRYLKLRICGTPPYTLKIHALRAVCERYPFPNPHAFKTADAQLQKVFDMCAYTIDLCTADNIFDTPCREQGQWMYDSCGVILDGLLWTFGETAMCRKYLDQTAHSILPTGTLAQLSNFTVGNWKVYTDSGLLFNSAMWEYYEFTGDDSLLFQYYPVMLMNMDFYRGYLNDDGLLENLSSVFLDWAYNASEDARNGISAPVNALLYRMMDDQEKICRLYGDSFRVKQLQSEKAKLKESFFRKFWIAERRCLSDSIIRGVRSDAASEYAHALAIMTGLLDGEAREEAILHVFDLRDADVLEAESFTSGIVIRALNKCGRFDLGMRIVRERWGARWADRGYTSTPENWTLFYCNGDISTQHTHSHAWSAGASAFFMRGLLGIEIVEPGFRAIRLNPQTPDHDCALHLLTPRGMIDAEFRSGKWKISVPDTIVIKE